MDYTTFANVAKHQLAEIPRGLWKSLWEKLSQETFDIGEDVQVCQAAEHGERWVELKDGVAWDAEEVVFLVDHAWTFPNDARAIRAALRENSALAARLEGMFALAPEAEYRRPALPKAPTPNPKPIQLGDAGDAAVEAILAATDGAVSRERAHEALVKRRGDLVLALADVEAERDASPHGAALKEAREALRDVETALLGQVKPRQDGSEVTTHVFSDAERVARVFARLWRYAGSYVYAVQGPDGSAEPVQRWFVPDEVGCALRHCDTPNVRCVPFLLPTARGLVGYSVLWPVRNVSSGERLSRDAIPAVYRAPAQRLAYELLVEDSGDPGALAVPAWTATGAGSHESTVSNVKTAKLAEAWTVYSDMEFVRANLPAGIVAESPQDAAVAWLYAGLEAYDGPREPPAKAIVSQLAGEECLVQKQRLAALVRQKYGIAGCPWFPATIDLSEPNGLAALAAATSLERPSWLPTPYWIVKPANQARGLGVFVTRNAARAARQQEVQPTLAQAYLSPPALYEGSKFDLRYIVVVTGVRPLRAHVYRRFWVRVANEPYDGGAAAWSGPDPLSTHADLDDDATGDDARHLTVMNYRGDGRMKQVDYTTLVNQGLNSAPWETEVQPQIDQVLRNVLALADATPAPAGLEDPKRPAFAVYGVDVLLAGSPLRPFILEVNFNPDCTRACRQEPSFVKHVLFRALSDLTVASPKALGARLEVDSAEAAAAWRTL